MNQSQFEMSLASEIRECERELDRILPRVSYLKSRIESLNRALDSMRQAKPKECECCARGVWVQRPNRQEIVIIGD